PWPAGEPIGPDTAVPGLSPRFAVPYVQSAVLSPRWVMTGGLVGTAPTWGPRRFWDLEAGRPYPLQIDDQGPPTYRLALSRDGQGIAVVFRRGDESRGDDWRAEFWDVATGQPAK